MHLHNCIVICKAHRVKMFIITLTLLLSFLPPSFTLVFSVENGDDLMSTLCDQHFNKSVTIKLNHSRVYSIASNRTCVVNTTNAITIESDTSDIVTVSCVNQDPHDPHLTSSFGFIDTVVTFTRIEFRSCGSLLKRFGDSLSERMNFSKMCFTENHSAMFVFVNSSVHLSMVSIKFYYGFAIIGIDLRNSDFTKLFITENTGEAIASKSPGMSIGSGMLILFTGVTQTEANVSLLDCTFFANFDFSNTSNQCDDPYSLLEGHSDCQPIKNAAALTIINNVHGDIGSQFLVSIKRTNISRNYGSYSGGLMIILANCTRCKVIISQGTVFHSNMNTLACPGSALTFHMEAVYSDGQSFLPLEFENVSFLKQNGMVDNVFNFHLFKYGALYIKVVNVKSSVVIKFKNVLFRSNEAEKYAACALVVADRESPKVQIVLVSVTVLHNTHEIKSFYLSNTGIFVFNNIESVVIKGTNNSPCVFFHNIGSVIQTENSNVHFSGNITFQNNRARSGAVCNMKESKLYFERNLNIIIEDNSAVECGGAFYIISKIVDAVPFCALQLSEKQTIKVSNNTAGLSGNVIFASPLYNCLSVKTNRLQAVSTSYYLNHFNLHLKSSNNILPVSTEPISFDFFGCDQKYARNGHYPGEKIVLNITARDYCGNFVYSQVKVSLGRGRKNKLRLVDANSSILPSESFQVLNENLYSTINVIVFYHDNVHHHGGEANETLYAIISNLQSSIIETVVLNLTSCPPGFALDHRYGGCNCSLAVKAYFESVNYLLYGKCTIDSLTISIPSYNFLQWVGSYSKTNWRFAVAGTCPVDFCSSTFHFDSSIFNETTRTFSLTTSTDLSLIQNFCKPHRKGVLCGECEEGYSVVFGSGECMKCSNWWLLTIVLYAIAGPLVILVVYSLKLTLTSGTINGIIFYAQAANVSVFPFLQFFPGGNKALSEFLTIFLSLLNLNLGFPLCFFDGMNELWKSGLSLAFPIYLLVIIVVLIILSHYSSWLSKKTSKCSVQVLVTIVHLSFSNILIGVINVLMPVTVYVDEVDKNEVIKYLVWFKNGMIIFGSRDHILFVVAILSLVSFFLVPYLCLIVGGRYLIRSSIGDKYLRAAYEAIHAPYKERRHYWFMARVLLLIKMILVFSLSQGNIELIAIITLPFLVAFLFVQLHLRPFKNSFLNFLDSTFLLNLVVLYILGWYIAISNIVRGLWIFYYCIVAIVLIAFLEFVLVVTYHIVMLTRIKHSLKSLNFQIDKKSCHCSHADERNPLALSGANDFHYGSCRNYREPLLSEENT